MELRRVLSLQSQRSLEGGLRTNDILEIRSCILPSEYVVYQYTNECANESRAKDKSIVVYSKLFEGKKVCCASPRSMRQVHRFRKPPFPLAATSLSGV